MKKIEHRWEATPTGTGKPIGWPADLPLPPWWGEFVEDFGAKIEGVKHTECPSCGFAVKVIWRAVSRQDLCFMICPSCWWNNKPAQSVGQPGAKVVEVVGLLSESAETRELLDALWNAGYSIELAESSSGGWFLLPIGNPPHQESGTDVTELFALYDKLHDQARDTLLEALEGVNLIPADWNAACKAAEDEANGNYPEAAPGQAMARCGKTR